LNACGSDALEAFRRQDIFLLLVGSHSSRLVYRFSRVVVSLPSLVKHGATRLVLFVPPPPLLTEVGDIFFPPSWSSHRLVSPGHVSCRALLFLL